MAEAAPPAVAVTDAWKEHPVAKIVLQQSTVSTSM